jgi:hypothetical protein
MNDLSRELGSALGIAVLGSALSSTYRSHVSAATTGLPPRAAAGAQSSIAFVKNASGKLAQYGPKGRHLLDSAQSSFVDAAHTAFLTAIVVLLAGAVFAAIRAPHKGDAPVSEAEVGSGLPAETA